MQIEEFRQSLQDLAPPSGACLPLQAVWWALQGAWDRAHDLVQGGDPESSWVHAALHRQEGDLANADYWYARAGTMRPDGSFEDEYLAIAAVLLRR
jgi:hypothetical protein